MALLHITDATGRQWQYELSPEGICTIGRAPDNCVVLGDPRASRHHAHVKFAGGAFVIVDGVLVGSVLQRSANKVLVHGSPRTEHVLQDGDLVRIGGSVLRFEDRAADSAVRYDDQRLGHTQLTIPAQEVLRKLMRAEAEDAAELEGLRRKADILTLIYELSRTLTSVFELEAVFDKAAEIVLRVTPADRVVALLREGQGKRNASDTGLKPVASRARDSARAARVGGLTVSRTITGKALRECVALLSQDASRDSQFAAADSVIMQGVRSTICAPLASESDVYGVIYADRLDPHAAFTRDDLELLSAIAAQTTVAVENVRAHERLAREEVARANYGRFLPEYVVRQMLDHPESFELGGVLQTITVLFADVREFTRLAEHAPPDRVVRLLNRYFTAMTEIIFKHGGTLDKYIGDGLMALFGAPASTPDDAVNALAAAAEMQRRLVGVNEELRAENLPAIQIGIGLHTGEATVGYIGSERRTEYTAIGDTVNLASRLEANARAGQILVSEAVAQAAHTSRLPLRAHPPLTVKNRVQPVQVFEVAWEEEIKTGSE
ncbi:MAG: adenylate/guanylate cyclase domain-containing protein [Pyrinomonadaceae bacterium]